MVQPKTRPTGASVQEFLASVPDGRRRADAEAVEALMREVTGEPAVLWGTSIVGYGVIEYVGSRGKQASWPVIAFAPRKSELVLYLSTELAPGLFEGLGPHRRGVGCVYIKRLGDVDQAVLRTLIEHSVELARR
jgi:Domain of unknown function (DU1801)